jgi:putative transferase (TIGR04331 family)
LISAGIVHTDEKSAAQHINKYWDNINLWWYNKETQNARIAFCDKYAKSIDKPILNLAKLLNNN